MVIPATYESAMLKLLASLVIVIEESGTDDAKLAVGYAKDIMEAINND